MRRGERVGEGGGGLWAEGWQGWRPLREGEGGASCWRREEGMATQGQGAERGARLGREILLEAYGQAWETYIGSEGSDWLVVRGRERERENLTTLN